MSSASPISFDSADIPPLPVHRFTVEQYHRLGELGVLTTEDRVELLEGWIVKKMNQRPLHGFVVRLLNEWLQRELPADWLAQCQLPITTDRSEPEPDLAIVRGAHTDYRDRHPRGNDCRLIIEVADSSLLKDRGKASIYAGAGVEEYWIINLVDSQLERFTESRDSAFRQTEILSQNDLIALAINDSQLRLPLTTLFAAQG